MRFKGTDLLNLIGISLILVAIFAWNNGWSVTLLEGLGAVAIGGSFIWGAMEAPDLRPDLRKRIRGPATVLKWFRLVIGIAFVMAGLSAGVLRLING